MVSSLEKKFELFLDPIVQSLAVSNYETVRPTPLVFCQVGIKPKVGRTNTLFT